MADFMEDHSDGNLDSPLVQLKQRLYFGEGVEDNVVWCGVYFADRNNGFRGAEGVMVFTSATANSTLKFAHMFAVPYTNDNGTNMRLVSGDGDLSKLYREMYDSRRVRVDLVDSGYRLTATVNDARGGVVACIASISNIAI
ncbi:hypothetical protein [Plantactinospora sp. CA-290183]|uniref:hypothetical protein n=1 Tax=Plantactinospora sp. CA-290183 TaxID=3240006 RepID=UPI003D8CE846